MGCTFRSGVGLTPDAEPLADYWPEANWKADARRGSKLLRKAILRSVSKPVPKRPLKRPLRRLRLYGGWEDRQLAIIQIERLQRTVADYFGLRHSDMTAYRGPQPIAEKRMLAMYLAREVIQASFPDIAKAFGGKDHTTVVHACQVIPRKPELADDIAALRRSLRT